jgi:2-oxoglutarate dehydrogenase E1 component
MEIINRYPNVEDVNWVQEEPKNQGAWYAMQSRMRTVVQRHKVDLFLRYVGRESSASAAAGYSALHMREQEKFIDEALGPMPWGF